MLGRGSGTTVPTGQPFRVCLRSFLSEVSVPLELRDAIEPLLPLAPSWYADPGVSGGACFEIREDETDPGRYCLTRDGVVIHAALAAGDVVPFLEWALTNAALESLQDQYLIHGGAVARRESGVIFPASSGRGKSSLVARLVGDGWSYLSDEVIVIDPSSRRLYPFAKSIHLHAGAREALRETHPILASREPYWALDGVETWYLPPSRDWLPTGPVDLNALVIPAFVAEAPTALQELSPSNALECLLHQSFNLRQHRSRAIGDLVGVLARTACYSLTYGNLDSAADALRRITGLDQ